MNYDFEKEIKALEESNIENKEKMFYIYIYYYLEVTELFAFWKRYCPKIDEKLIRNMQKYLARIFECAIEYFNLKNHIKDYAYILNLYFNYIYEQQESLLRELQLETYFRDMTTYFLNERSLKLRDVSRDYERDQFIPRYSNEVIDRVLNNLDSTNLDFRAKAISILNIKYHIDEILCLDYTYAIKRSLYSGLQSILGSTIENAPCLIIDPYNTVDKLIDCIPTMVSGNEPISFEILKEKTFQFLNEEISKCNPSNLIRNKRVLEFYLSLNENGKKLFWQVLIRFLSGYPYDYEAQAISWKETIRRTKTKIRINNITNRLWHEQYDITGRLSKHYE